jgi:hypothetical protein
VNKPPEFWSYLVMCLVSHLTANHADLPMRPVSAILTR